MVDMAFLSKGLAYQRIAAKIKDQQNCALRHPIDKIK